MSTLINQFDASSSSNFDSDIEANLTQAATAPDGQITSTPIDLPKLNSSSEQNDLPAGEKKFDFISDYNQYKLIRAVGDDAKSVEENIVKPKQEESSDE